MSSNLSNVELKYGVQVKCKTALSTPSLASLYAKPLRALLCAFNSSAYGCLPSSGS